MWSIGVDRGSRRRQDSQGEVSLEEVWYQVYDLERRAGRKDWQESDMALDSESHQSGESQ